MVDHRGVAVAKEDIGTRAFIQHEAEIFGPHQGRGVGVDAARNGHRNFCCKFSVLRGVYRDGVAAVVVNLGRGPKRHDGACNDFLDPCFHEVLHAVVHRADGAFHRHDLRNDVVRGAVGFHRADADHDLLQRVDVAAGDGLQGDDDVGADHSCVDAVMRFGGMATLAGHHDLELVGGSHHRAGADGEVTERDTGHVVHAVNFVDIPAG